MELQGKVALVTGGGIRVGKTLALTLADAGARVAVHYNSSEGDARDTVERIRGSGGSAELFKADLTDATAPRSLIDAVSSRMGGLDVLVNSAAVMIRTPFEETTTKQWDDIFKLNLRAPFFLSQAAAPSLRRVHGAIINIADLAAYETWPGYIPHGLTKGGVVQMTRALARVMAPEVRVNAIAPGTVLRPDDMSQRDATHLVETTPLRRDGSPEDVASTMMFLLRAEYITGETIIVDGGRHVRR
jgi:pteridine reductase